ncbi:ferrous iron transport protein A [Herbaspirillum huttiense]|jgi:ferrous iron transport protein A|uniref:Ferrous iron transport protein A n=3 Tax=Herbaspirillum huttiense TaxID=863372 RepID=A0AAJ2LSC3_9BURK|nr:MULTISPECIES: ferrous iron transport protein A [Herbaspirillum]MAF01978.1 ferrous iron transport protein A [Herbaspirillum sp.]MBO15963.1 ferrous iron transport protein A [Herbaspirillum sp.]MBP1318012.1 ferrous iron transport protein A [Herbaspirillum sp. 1130]MCO4859471.1 ferrous iron transport protein A [Herbaspirillum sp. WGmk3]MCP3657032.1 ferrous iron transport protein A [Herbaspirillum sp.]|tara:strand:- start:1014 stop:1259 length:246 start_codon:yes stop_codon:yes gene_type:complete
MRLTELAKGVGAIVDQVTDLQPADAVAARLRDLGFVRGEPVRVVASAPFGGDPIVVQIGSTRFALRRAEAERVTLAAGAAA